MKKMLLTFSGSVEHDPAIPKWFDARSGELGSIARTWYEYMRQCGGDVRELLHDGCPTVCVQDAPFAYVAVFSSHVNIGFFHGVALLDPQCLLEGTGKYIRHVKLRPGQAVNIGALEALIAAAYRGITKRVRVDKKTGPENNCF